MNQQLLRPNFTTNIYEYYIKKGKSLNIFGAKGVGKSRFIEDLELLVEDDTYFIILDMRELRTDYKKFIKRLANELSIKGSFKSVALVLDKFARKKGKKVLVIDHFEYLFEENRDNSFNFDFFEHLNSFKNSEDVSLIVISSLNYRNYHFYKNNKLTTSPLDIELKQLTSLMQKEIEDELSKIIVEPLDFKLLATLIMGKKYPYSFIKHIISEIEFGNYKNTLSAEKNFNNWQKSFQGNNKVLWHLWILKHIKQLNPSSLKKLLKEVIGWFKKTD